MIKTSLLALCSVATAASATDVIFETNNPFGSPFGLIGFDVSTDQGVGVRFVPDQDYTLSRISCWFMSNDFASPLDRPVRLSVQTDASLGDAFIPSGIELEVFDLIVTAVGWDPQLDSVDSDGGTVLRAGEAYWIVAESDYSAGRNPVWNWATGVNGYTAVTEFGGGAWQAGGTGWTVGIVVEGETPTCRADIDGDGSLTIFDFLAFQNLFDAGDPAADFDGDGSLTLFDFLAFQNEFDGGCG